MTDDSETVTHAVEMLGTEVTFSYCGEEYAGVVRSVSDLHVGGTMTYAYTVELDLHPRFVGTATIYRMRPNDAWLVRSLHIAGE